MDTRHFGTIAAPLRGGLVIDGDDGLAAHVDAAEAASAGLALQIGDRIEYSLRPGGAAFDVMLCAYTGERHRI